MKKRYITPMIDKVVLDREISLQLASDPTPNPWENGGGGPNPARQDPYQYDEW